MANTPTKNNKREIITSLSLHNVIVLLTALGAIASSFFMYDRRIAVLEEARLRDEQTISNLNSDLRAAEHQSYLDRQVLESEINQERTEIEVLKANKK